MSENVKGALLGAVGLILYGAAMFGSIAAYHAFWTDQRFGDTVPWYYVGQTFVQGSFALVALLVILGLGFGTSRWLGPSVWSNLWPAAIFLSSPTGQWVNVMAHTSHIWSPTDATCAWATFDEYLRSNTAAGVVSMVIFSIIWFGRATIAHRRAA
jgi:hypothetical protein